MGVGLLSIRKFANRLVRGCRERESSSTARRMLRSRLSDGSGIYQPTRETKSLSGSNAFGNLVTNCRDQRSTCCATAYTNSEQRHVEIHYRVLYFFHKQIAAVVAHG